MDGIFIAMDEREKRHYVFNLVRVLEGEKMRIKLNSMALH